MDKNVSYSYEALGTLCDEPNGLTCSFDVAKRWGRAERVAPYSTFEEAANDVKVGTISAFLVPGAYPYISNFIMDANLTAVETFIMKIPPLVLVGIPENPPLHATVLFHHPATTPLLPEVEIDYERDEFVTSNSKACSALFQNDAPAIAITNGLCAEFYRLNVYKILREGILMPFICFTKSKR